MSIHFGDDIKRVHFGDDIKHVYYGSEKIWSKIIPVTPQAPTFHFGSPWVTLPTVTGVDYQTVGAQGWGSTVTVTATARPGYGLVGTTSWTHAWPARYSADHSDGSFTAARNEWQTVLFINMTEHLVTSGTWSVSWNSPLSTASYGVRIAVSGVPVFTNGPVTGLTLAGISLIAPLTDLEIFPGQQLQFQCFTDGSTTARRGVRSTTLSLS